MSAACRIQDATSVIAAYPSWGAYSKRRVVDREKLHRNKSDQK
jgi:hypothetical protein